MRVTKNAPYICGNFYACAITRFQKQQQLGRALTACSSIVTSRAQRAWPRSAASAVASCGWNYWQRRLDSCSSSSSLQRGWSARMATRWSSHRPACSIRYRSPHVSSSANDSRSFKKFLGARSRRPPHTFRVVTGTEPQFVVLFGKRSEFGDNREVWKAFVCQYAPPRSCSCWGTAEAKRCMPAPRRLRWMASDVIDDKFALRICQ